MNEKEWARLVASHVSQKLRQKELSLVVSCGTKLSYAHEIREYSDNESPLDNTVGYETDLLVAEKFGASRWKPRVVIETKLRSVTTHDAITYSEKASTHKKVHPYLRYGILVGGREHYPLPGRLFRHGVYFDFMLSLVALEPSPSELKLLVELLIDEVEASRNLEDILYTSRSRNRKKYTLLHKPIRLGEA